MSLKSKGFFLYEALLSLSCLLVIITTFSLHMMTLKATRLKANETYKMKQELIVNLILYENDQPLLESDRYLVTIDDTIICIREIESKEGGITYCLPYEK